MTLYVSKLSIGRGGNPIGDDKLIIGPCEIIDEDADFEKMYEGAEIEETDEIEVVSLDNEDEEEFTIEILIDELRKCRLRQGWGLECDGRSMDLRKSYWNPDTKRIEPEKEWVCDTIYLYKCIWNADINRKQAIGRFRILSRLLEMKEDDIVFVPNIPSNDMFSVATVDGGYEFELMEDYEDHGHIIHVRDVKEYHYGDDTIPKKVWSFPPAVVRIRKEDEFKKFLDKSYFNR